MEIDQKDRSLLADECEKSVEKKIIITHGTDTIIETAKFLSKIKNKIIILTGSMRPERFSNSDANINIGVAIGGVQSLKNGVYIALNGLIMPFDKVKRNMETGQFMLNQKLMIPDKNNLKKTHERIQKYIHKEQNTAIIIIFLKLSKADFISN